MRQFSERERMQAALIGVLALGLLYFLVIAPAMETQRLAAQTQLDAAHAAAARLDRYHRETLADGPGDDALRVRYGRLVAALPAAREQGAFIRAVQRRAHAAGVTVDAVAPETPVQEETLTMQPMALSFHGGYFAVLDFLRALQEDERAVQFGALDLRAEDGGLRCVLTVKIASLAEKDAADSPEYGN